MSLICALGVWLADFIFCGWLNTWLSVTVEPEDQHEIWRSVLSLFRGDWKSIRSCISLPLTVTWMSHLQGDSSKWECKTNPVLLVTYIFFQQRLAKCVLGNYQLQPWLCFGENWISQSTASISTAFCTDIRGPLMNSDFHPALPTFQIWFVRKAAQSFKSVATSSGSGSTHFFLISSAGCWTQTILMWTYFDLQCWDRRQQGKWPTYVS